MTSMHSASITVSVINDKDIQMTKISKDIQMTKISEDIQMTNNPYSYYNNRFVNGPKSHDFENQTVKPEIGKFLTVGMETGAKNSLDIGKSDISSDEFSRSSRSLYEPNLEIDLLQSNPVQNNDIRKSIQDGHKPICIPLKVDGAPSVIPFEEHCLPHRHTECHKDNSKWVLTGEETPRNIVQDDMSDYTRKQKIDKEAIVDLAANKYNYWNLDIHDCLWCPCILYFTFFCCIPALMLMRQSDIAFQKGLDSTARLYARCSSLFYGIGLVLSLAFYALIVTLVVVFTR